MKLDIEIGRQDYADFNAFHFVKTKLKRVIISGFVTLAVVEIAMNLKEFEIWSTIISSLIFMGLYAFAIYRSLSNTRKIPKDGGSILGHRELDLTEEAILCKTPDSSSSSAWSRVKALEEGKRAFYLYVDTNMAMLIPKRSFHSEEDMLAFKTFVAEKMKAANVT